MGGRYCLIQDNLVDISVRFLDSSGEEIAEPPAHKQSPATLYAGELIRFKDVPFSVEFLNLTEVEKLDMVTIFASFDTGDVPQTVVRSTNWERIKAEGRPADWLGYG